LITLRTPIYVINIIIVFLAIGIIVYNIMKFILGKKHDFITVVLGIGYIIMSVLFVITNISVDVNSSRYIAYFAVLVAIVLVRNMKIYSFSKNNKMYWMIFALMLCALLGKFYTITNEAKSEPVLQQKLSAVLLENNLTSGYASYWNASSITVLSDGNVNVRAIAANNEKLEAFEWLSKDEWYKEYANFVIIADNDLFGVTGEIAKKNFGTPSEIIDCGQFHIYKYEKDISAYLSNWCEKIIETGGILHGIYGFESEYAWSNANCELQINKTDIGKNGLECVFNIPQELFLSSKEPVKVEVSLDGTSVFEHVYEEPAEEIIVIKVKDLNELSESSVYTLEINCDKWFVPCELGINSDTRALSLQIRYIGDIR